MRLKSKLILLAMLPLVSAVGLIAVTQHQQAQILAARQEALMRRSYVESARNDLRHYTALALSTISPLYNTGRNDDEIKLQVIRQLSALDYGSDGYFFLYNFDGINLMHPRQPELVGRNLLNMRDETGQFPIRMMRDLAQSGGGFVEYSWNKPSTQSPAPKIAYVTPLDRWGWWFGTGVYVDDIDRVLAELNASLAASSASTLRWLAVIMGGGLLLIFGGGLWISMYELRVADAKLILLAHQLVGSQEAERAHLSRELHDGTGQTLVAAKLLTEAALDRLPADDKSARPALSRAVDRLKDALAEVRGMSHRLRPLMLDTLGLSAALSQLAEEMWALSDTRFSVKVEGPSVPLPEDINTVLFRVTQEALANIQKHANANWVEILLVFSKRGVTLMVRDNGQGFDTGEVLHDPNRGIGLRNMRERLASIDGRLDVISRPGQTLMTAFVPDTAIERFSLPTA